LLTLLPVAAAAVGLVALVVCATPARGAVTLVDSLLTASLLLRLLLPTVGRESSVNLLTGSAMLRLLVDVVAATPVVDGSRESC
jgi:hypothetical protein